MREKKVVAAQKCPLIKLFSLFNKCFRRLWGKQNYHYLLFVNTVQWWWWLDEEGNGRMSGWTREGVCRRRGYLKYSIFMEAWLNYFP